MPDMTTPMSIELAEQDLIFSNVGANRNKYYRWQDKPAIKPLNDYEKLMVYLFSDAQGHGRVLFSGTVGLHIPKDGTGFHGGGS